MKLQLLGTAAAEAWPAPFCVCSNCEGARQRGGPNIRGRAGAILDDDLKIDFGPDTTAHLQRFGRNLAHIRTILFTHQHSDHVDTTDLNWVISPYTKTPPSPIDVWGNSATIEMIQLKVTAARLDNNLRLHTIRAGDMFQTATGDQVVAMAADHVAGAMVHRITRGGKTIFYGHDSGLYPQSTLERLADGTKLDIALFDCTVGGLREINGRKYANTGHMNIDGVVAMVEKLRQCGAITDTTRAIATHFSHNGGLLHEELVRELLPHRIEAAYDGMIVEV